MRAGLGVGVGKFGQIWAKVGRFGSIRLIGQGWVTLEVGGCGYTCRSRDGYRWVWESLGRYGQGWAKVGRSGWVRLMRVDG